MNINQKALNYVKSLSAETITNANAGNLGVCLGASSILFALFKDHYNFDVSDTDFLNRDRFVLSSGNASALYYTLLSMFGFDLTLQDLKNFGKKGSKTPLVPTYGVTEGVEISTGPSGQGVANAVGLAIAEMVMEERFNTVGFDIVNNHTYCFVDDNDLMEGVAMEAVSLAGNLKLKNLILLYDNNEVTKDGALSLSNKENIAKKFSAMGWNVLHVANGNSYFFCSRAIGLAKKSPKPTIIIFDTMIGIGSSKEGTSSAHTFVMSKSELEYFKSDLKIKESFFIPSDVRELCMTSTRRGMLNHEKWNQNLAMYSSTNPELYKSFFAFFDRKKINYDRILKNVAKYGGLSTTKLNHYVLNELSYQCPQMIGGTADDTASTMCSIDNAGNFSSNYRRGKNIKYGVREFAMSAVANGISMYEDFITFDSCKLTYSTNQLPAIRMRNQMNLPVMTFFTNDSVLAGGVNPCYQPIEQLSHLRAISGNVVFRPCDYRELVAGYTLAVRDYVPICFALSKQNIPQIKDASYENAMMGGYIIKNHASADAVVVATGSEVEIALKVAENLQKKYRINVVSMPSIEIYEKQPQSYKNKVIPKDVKLIAVIELSNDTKWYKLFGEKCVMFGLDTFVECGVDTDMNAEMQNIEKNIEKVIENKLKDKKK